ncbi:1-phosphofructokinase family hexose kinase [Microbacterium sp. ZXX196]|uniref:1-phosphofructokinase family hexose kinase n=1 Tax=Microbacterium sp. ZXX196 TaxID=2609291 RepID=UPI0012B71755|nr:1-phosphofructokinase family hexose kinase [Microbacterium sp. ZXX196]MTE23346.1 hexose kinase [Microbacterium sp. ZXX196]
MIVTLTANPSLDRTVELPGPLAVGEVQPASGAREDAAGKGINVARVLHAAGDAVRGVLPLSPADPYATALGQGLPTVAVPVSGNARANITLTDPAGTTTKINLPGAALDEPTRRALIDAVVAVCARDDAGWLALCGSLPPGAGDDFYVDVIRAVRERVARPPLIAVDTSGAALARVVAGGRPDLIKPNEDELAELAGRALPDAALPEAVALLAREIVPGRVGAALVTLGGAGAVLVTADEALHAPIPRGVAVRSTVGAGDSALAGYLHADAAGLPAAARLVSAVRYGSATASLPGTQLATPADLPSGDVAVAAVP